MHRRQQRTDRLDVPATLRELYPDARIRRRVRVLAPGELFDDDRPMRRLRRAIRAVLFTVIALPIMLVSRGSEGALEIGSSASGAVTSRLFRVTPFWPLWNRWARARGAVRTSELPDHPAMSASIVELDQSRLPSYRVRVGKRGVSVQLASVAVRAEHATHHGAYVALVQLPDAVAERFPSSTFLRRQGLGLAKIASRELKSGGGNRLELESIALHEGASLTINGGDELDWRQLLDPALVDLLAEGICIEWIQTGNTLLLHTPAPMRSIEMPEARRLDALCVAAVAIERRLATIVGGGEAVAPAVDERAVAVGAAKVNRHLARERARDLSLDIDEQFAELARYTSDEEVELVRRRIDAGQFRVDHLDDLIHHRRARFWGADGDGATLDDASPDDAGNVDAA